MQDMQKRWLSFSGGIGERVMGWICGVGMEGMHFL